MLRTLTCLALLAAAPLSAQEGPSFDCAKAGSTVEEAICADPVLSAADRALGDTYARALAVAGALDAGADEAVATLKATQRGWIKGRDECWKASDLSPCVADAYLRRRGELVALWMLEDVRAERVWTCEGNPANEVHTMTFGDDVLRAEYGDQIDAMIRVRSASGVKWEGSFGRMIWEKGPEAMIDWGDGREMACVAAD